ncbi:hypothetical protein SDC9_145711 [bioreactor metagenome]|uniref:Uncharacterized protein n=1 Tax=bioreactor metagenome TaxID=1076179 RepID=A0A645ECN7_9ZZZZ
MERQRDHRLDRRKIDFDHRIVVRDAAGLGLAVHFLATMDFIIFAHPRVSLPDRRKARGLGRHHVDAVPKIDREFRNAGADELHHLVFYQAVLEHRAAERDRDVVRADARAGFARKVYEHHLRRVHIVGIG